MVECIPYFLRLFTSLCISDAICFYLIISQRKSALNRKTYSRTFTEARVDRPTIPETQTVVSCRGVGRGGPGGPVRYDGHMRTVRSCALMSGGQSMTVLEEDENR